MPESRCFEYKVRVNCVRTVVSTLLDSSSELRMTEVASLGSKV